MVGEKEGGSRTKERRTCDDKKCEDQTPEVHLKKASSVQSLPVYETLNYYQLVHEDLSYSKVKLKQRM